MMALIKELLLENWSLKLTAIFLAFILWLVVHGDPSAERVVSIPLEVRVPRGMEITSERPATVDVTVRGIPSNMWFGASPPSIVVDMQSFDEGEHIIPLLPSSVRFPRASGLEAVAVRPARLKLKLERTIAKEVPVKIAPKGEPGHGIDLYGITFNPSSIVISGPRSSIESIREVATESLSIAGKRQSVRAFLNLDIRDDAVHASPAGPVEVNVQLGPHRKLERVAGVPVAADAAGYSLAPRIVTLQVLVPITYEKPFTPADFIAGVAASRMPPDTQAARLRPEVRLRNIADPAIAIKSIQPAEILVQRVK